MQDPSTTFALLQQLKQPQFPEQEQQQLRCPRCDSTNTKFCYYNNYNLSQPRHFCKSCRRYWTKGGSLRNIPVGGATRKTSKRPSSSSSTTPAKRPASSPLPPLSAGPNPEPGPGSGEFDSLLASNGQFGNLLQGIRSDSDRVLHLPSSCGVGESSQIVGESVRCWANDGDQNSNDGWPDLAIFTPASGFH